MIYLITNKLNNKKYVGQTKLTLKDRWIKHCSLNKTTSKTSLLSKAIRKYGRDNFLLEVLVSEENEEQRNFLEIYFIKKLNTLSPNGYNLTKGGAESCPEKNKKSVKSLNTKTNQVTFYESAYEAERTLNLCRGSIHQAIKKKTKTGGFLWAFEKEEFIIRKHGLAKSIVAKNIITGEEINYEKITDAEIDGFLNGNIVGCLKGRKKQYKGYFWRYS